MSLHFKLVPWPLRRIGWRAVQAVPLVLGVLTISFLLTHILPGNPGREILGPLAPASQVAALNRRLGFDNSIVVQYVDYLVALFHGNLGTSIQSQTPVASALLQRVGPTVELIGLGASAALAYGVAVGYVASRDGVGGRISRVLIGVGQAVPDFVLGLVLIFVFFFVFRWLPPPLGQLGQGVASPRVLTGAAAFDALLTGSWATLADAAAHLVLPVTTLGVIYGSPIARVAAERFAETNYSPHIVYGRLIGLSRKRLAQYRVRTILPVVLTTAGVVLGYLIGGDVLIETVFSWGGLGQYAAQSVLASDIPAIQGVMLVAAIMTLCVYLALDLVYEALDPRVRLGRR